MLVQSLAALSLFAKAPSNTIQVGRVNWVKFKDIYYINGNDLKLIDDKSAFSVDTELLAPALYYFIQIKDPFEAAIKLPAKTIFFKACIGGSSAHKFLAESLLKLKSDQLNSGGDLSIGEKSTIDWWSMRTYSYHEVLALDKELDPPQRVGLPNLKFKDVLTKPSAATSLVLRK